MRIASEEELEDMDIIIQQHELVTAGNDAVTVQAVLIQFPDLQQTFYNVLKTVGFSMSNRSIHTLIRDSNCSLRI